MTVLGHGYDDNVGAPAFRNVIINGGMNVWQRSTSSTTLGYATADRWWVNNGGGTTTIAREATIVPSKFQYAMKWTQATTANVVGIQAIESINCAHLVGQTVTITGYFAASASTSFTIDLLSSTSIDVAPASFSTSITPTSGGSGTVSSTTYVRVSGVYVVPSNVKSLAVRINATSLTNGTSFYFTGVQLEAGPVATPFEFEPFETTLRKCQRYYQIYDTVSDSWTTTMIRDSSFGAGALYGGFFFQQTMRTTPTTTFGNPSSSSTLYPTNTTANVISASHIALASTGAYAAGYVVCFRGKITLNAEL